MENQKDNVEETTSKFGDLSEIDQQLYSEMHPFALEVDLYKTNLLHVLVDLIGKEMTRLTPLQRDIILRCFFKGESTVYVGKTLKLGQANVVHTKQAALKKLRTGLLKNPYFMQLYTQYIQADPPLAALNALAAFLQK